MTKGIRGRTSGGTRDAEGVLVITGMHRSGTSLVASLLEIGGLHLGEKMLPADQGNPRGYFEDLDFYGFHSEALENRQQLLSVAEDFQFEPTPSERRRAQAIISGRRHRRFWGWKDPRTALFLDFWNEQLPETRFLFLFRHPLDVLLSLVRRGDVNCLGLTEGLDAWTRYNEKILRFFIDHRERSLLCHIRSVLESTDSFATLLRDRLGFEIERSYLEAVYHPKELRHIELAPEVADAFRSIHPSVARLYDHLNESADLRYVGTPNHRQSRGKFGAWVKDLETKKSPGLRRGLTSALIALVEPESLENLYRVFGGYQLERNRGLAWLKGRVEGMEALLKRSGESNEKLRAWTEELERGRDWLEEQRRNLELTLEQQREGLEGQLDEERRHRERGYAELESWIQELERGRDWLLDQRTHFEEDQRRRAEQNEELRKWVGELEQGREWLQQQWTHSRMEIEQYRGENETLRAWTVELERGRDWLKEQRRNLELTLEQQRENLEGQLDEERRRRELELEARQRGYAELESWIRELERARDWLQQQWAHSRMEIEQYRGENETLRAWTVELERGRDWLEEHRRNLELTLEQQRENLEGQLDEERRRRELELEARQRGYAELESWIRDLERGRDWLLEQRTHFEEDQRGRAEQNEELRRWVAELERGRDWLLEQRTHFEEDQRRRAEQNEELRRWVAELERGRDWLLEQRTHFEEDQRQRAKQNEELRRWVAELEQGRDWLQQQRSNLDAALTRSVAEARALGEQTTELREHIEQLRSREDARELELRRLFDVNVAAERRALELNDEVERLSTRLASVEASLSWRSIAALRRLRSRIFAGPSWKPKS